MDDQTLELAAMMRSALDGRSPVTDPTIRVTAVSRPSAGAAQVANSAAGGDAGSRPARASLPRVAQHVPGYYLG